MLNVRKINNVTIVKFNNIERFNALITEPVKEEIKDLFQIPDTKLVLNLEGVKFIDSSGFGVFLSIMKAANNNHGQLKISNVSDDVMELFKLLQLHNVFEIYPTEEECAASFS